MRVSPSSAPNYFPYKIYSNPADLVLEISRKPQIPYRITNLAFPDNEVKIECDNRLGGNATRLNSSRKDYQLASRPRHEDQILPIPTCERVIEVIGTGTRL